jgi:hypothetical protein
MKKISVCVLSLAAVAAVSWSLTGFRAEAQTSGTVPAGTPPVGRQVVVKMTMPTVMEASSKIEGTLVAMTDLWIVVKDGSDENWLPRDKVMYMKADLK